MTFHLQFQENDLCEAFYDSNWYVMPIKHQKYIQRVIEGKQQGARLIFGPFGIINHELFKTVSNNSERNNSNLTLRR